MHPALIGVVERAIQLTRQDFSVHDGLRSMSQQLELVRTGASKTMESRHLTGHAVDLVPYVNGKLRWEWNLIYPIAEAMRQAATEKKVALVWGGAWDVLFTDSTKTPEQLVHDYIDKRRALGKSAFIDGPHYELSKTRYPA